LIELQTKHGSSSGIYVEQFPLGIEQRDSIRGCLNEGGEPGL
jgi:hypothetical protein